MNILKKLAIGSLVSLLTLFLFVLALNVGILKLVGQPQDVKGLIDRSGVFENVVPNLLDQAQENSKTNDGLSLSNPAIKSAAEKVFTPQFLRSTLNQTIDDIYLWLDGKVEQPPIRIDLSAQKEAFASEVAAIVAQRAQGLPKCTRANTPTSFDPLTAPCLPVGVSTGQAATEAKNQILGQEDFLKDPVITADNFKSKNGQSIFESQLKNAPRAYQKAKIAPYVLSVLVLLLAAGIVLLSASRLHGLRRVGIILAVMGILMIVIAWSLDYGVNQKLLPQISLDNSAIKESFKALISDVSRQLNGNYWLFGGLYAGLGALAIVGSIVISRRGGETKHPNAPVEPHTNQDKTPSGLPINRKSSR